MLVTSIFSFSHNGLKRALINGGQKSGLCGKELNNVFYPMKAKFNILSNIYFAVSKINPFRNKPWFLHVSNKRLLKTLWKKENLLVMRTFCPFHRNSKLSSAKSFSLKRSKICRLGKD